MNGDKTPPDRQQLEAGLSDLRASFDETLAGWRANLDAARNEPVAPDTTVTPNSVPALLGLLRALPGIVGQSISGDVSRLDAARHTLAELQQTLASGGIELDERFTGFADRLANLRRETELKRADATSSSAEHHRPGDDPRAESDPSNPGPSR